MTSPTPQTFDTLADRRSGNVRKPLEGAVLLGRHPEAPIVTTLVAPNGQIAMPEAFKSTGLISEDGATGAFNRELSQLRGWGSSAYVRQDIRSEDHTLQFKAIESRKLTMELRDNVNLATKTISAAGELAYSITDRPEMLRWRVITLGKDGSGDKLIYMAKIYHQMFATEVGDDPWSDGDDPIGYDVTMSAELDDEAGVIGEKIWFGPGLLARAAAMGFDVEPVTP